MKRTFLTIIVFIAAIAFLALALADREIQAGIRRLSNYRFPPRSALDADPGPGLMANPGGPAVAERWPAKPASLSPDHDGLR
jgi:hypothetical protein